MKLCHICGNEFQHTSQCPFCGSSRAENLVAKKNVFTHKTINLEIGRPKVDIAISRMKAELITAKNENTTCVTFIHGYGSSGKGGVIREECRKVLSFMLARGEINSVVFGEEFKSSRGQVKHLLRRFPKLENNKNFNRNNKGITLVVF